MLLLAAYGSELPHRRNSSGCTDLSVACCLRQSDLERNNALYLRIELGWSLIKFIQQIDNVLVSIGHTTLGELIHASNTPLKMLLPPVEKIPLKGRKSCKENLLANPGSVY